MKALAWLGALLILPYLSFGQGNRRPQNVDLLKIRLVGSLSLTGNEDLALDAQHALGGYHMARDAVQSWRRFEGFINITLNITDDEGDPVKVRELYSEWLQTHEEDSINIYLGPMTASLSQIAAQILNGSDRILLLPFAQLPDQDKYKLSKTDRPQVLSFEVDAKHIMAPAMLELQAKGANTVVVWNSNTSDLKQICEVAASAAEAAGMTIMHRHTGADIHDAEELMELSKSAAPDVFLACTEPDAAASLLIVAQDLQYEPKAMLFYGSSDPEFWSALQPAVAVGLLDRQSWFPAYEPCSENRCRFFSRGEFMSTFQGNFDSEPQPSAAQAAVAGLAAFEWIEEIRASRQTTATRIVRSLNTYSSREISQLISKFATGDVANYETPDTHWHPLLFDMNGSLANPQLVLSKLGHSDVGAIRTMDPINRYMNLTSSSAEKDDYPRRSYVDRVLWNYPCDPGYVLNETEVIMMAMNEIANSSGVCEACSIGKSRNLGFFMCLSCEQGYQATATGQSECKQCRAGAVCQDFNDSITVAPGYYQIQDSLIQCPEQENCQGENKCFGNSDGNLCAACKPGFGKFHQDEGKDWCGPCDELIGKHMFGIILIAGLHMALFFLLRQTHLRSSKSMLNTGAFFLRSFLWYLQFSTIVTHKVLVTSLPDSLLKDLAFIFSAFLLDPLSLLPDGCFGTSKLYELKLVFALTLLPSLLVLAAVVRNIQASMGLIRFLQERLSVPDDGDDDEASEKIRGQLKLIEEKRIALADLRDAFTSTAGLEHEIHVHHSVEQHVTCMANGVGLQTVLRDLTRNQTTQEIVVDMKVFFFIFSMTFYPMILNNLLEPMDCIIAQMASGVDTSVTVLRVDASTICGLPESTSAVFLACVGLLIYGVGIPVLMTVIIFTTKDKRTSLNSVKSIGVVIGAYKYRFAYMTIAIMLTQAALLVFSVFQGRTLSLVATVLLLAGLTIFVGMHAPFDPRDGDSLNKLMTLNCVCQVFATVMGYLQVTELGEDYVSLALMSGVASIFAPAACLAHVWTIIAHLRCGFDVFVLKHLRTHAHLGNHKLGNLQRRLHAVFRLDRGYVTLYPDTNVVDTSELGKQQLRIFQETVAAALRRYFHAVMKDTVPWSEVLKKTDGEEEDEKSDEGLKLLYTGFLTAGMKRAFLIAELSWRIRKLHDQLAEDPETFIQGPASVLLPSVDRDGESEGEEERSGSPRTRRNAKYYAEEPHLAHAGKEKEDQQFLVSMVQQHILKAPIRVHVEELYCAMMLCFRGIHSGKLEFYRLAEEDLTERHEGPAQSVEVGIKQWRPEESVDEFLQDLTENDLIELQQHESTEPRGKEFIVEARPKRQPPEKQPSQGRPIPSLLKPRPTNPEDQPEETSDNVDGNLAQLLGLYDAASVLNDYDELYDEHKRYFREVMELTAENQELKRKIMAEADHAALSDAPPLSSREMSVDLVRNSNGPSPVKPKPPTSPGRERTPSKAKMAAMNASSVDMPATVSASEMTVMPAAPPTRQLSRKGDDNDSKPKPASDALQTTVRHRQDHLPTKPERQPMAGSSSPAVQAESMSRGNSVDMDMEAKSISRVVKAAPLGQAPARALSLGSALGQSLSTSAIQTVPKDSPFAEGSGASMSRV